MQPIIYTYSHAEILYFPEFLSSEEAEFYYQALLKSVKWEQSSITIFGKKIPQPRLSALYAKNDVSYTYSGLTLHPEPYSKELLNLDQKIREACGFESSHCLANLYRDGNDSMGWHSDDEKVLGKNPTIASLSLGAERKFMLKHKKISGLKKEIILNSGSLLLMQGKTQHFWKHQLPKTKKIHSPRINLTFRKIF
ncbi:MAG: alpha-ketoglutarate-dependent dioxygenase AlkB [Gillisia sp.]